MGRLYAVRQNLTLDGNLFAPGDRVDERKLLQRDRLIRKGVVAPTGEYSEDPPEGEEEAARSDDRVAQAQARVEELSAENDLLRERVKELEAEVERLGKGGKKELAARVKDLEKENAELSRENERLFLAAEQAKGSIPGLADDGMTG